MNVFLILVIVICILSILAYWGEWSTVLYFIVSCSVYIIILGILSGFILGWQLDPQPSPRTQLINLQDGSGIYGKFYLGSGTIQEYPAYYYYKEIAPNQYVYNILIKRPDTARIVVFTDEENNPYLKTLQKCYKQIEGFWWVSLNISFCNIIQQEFHVPKNSIIQNFRLDAAR